MSPTYPEKMSLLGPSSWEEIAHIHTDRQTTGFHPPSHSPPHITRNFLFSIFYTQLPRCARELDKAVGLFLKGTLYNTANSDSIITITSSAPRRDILHSPLFILLAEMNTLGATHAVLATLHSSRLKNERVADNEQTPRRRHGFANRSIEQNAPQLRS